MRTARRLGADPATLVYRRSRTEMPARVEEVNHAEEEGVVFQMLINPVEILGDEKGWVRAVRCQRMELGEPDASGRRRPVPITGSEFEIPCEVVIEAIGTRANPLLTATTPDLKLNKWGNIEVDANGMTSKPGVFAGGDIVRGAATVILAMGDGKSAAAAIDSYLKQHQVIRAPARHGTWQAPGWPTAVSTLAPESVLGPSGRGFPSSLSPNAERILKPWGTRPPRSLQSVDLQFAICNPQRCPQATLG